VLEHLSHLYMLVNSTQQSRVQLHQALACTVSPLPSAALFPEAATLRHAIHNASTSGDAWRLNLMLLSCPLALPGLLGSMRAQH
jgi:hypothetical protein